VKKTRNRKFILPVPMLAVFLLTAASAHAAIVAVQANAGMASSASSEALAFISNTTAGDIILVGFDFASGSTFSSISDSQGNTFTEVGSQLTTPAGSGNRLYYAKNIIGGADTVTVRTTASASFIKVQVVEYSGVNTSTPIDVQYGNTGSAGSASAGGVTNFSNEMIFGFLASDGTGSAASGFTTVSAANGNVIINDAGGSPGGYYYSEGSSTAGWSMQMAALELASTTETYACSTSSATGNCGSYGDTEVTDNAGGNANVQNDVWDPQTGWSQTLYTVSEGRWWVTANMESGYTGVQSYPDTDILFSNWSPSANPEISSFSYIFSSFVSTVPTSSGTIEDSGYDLWFNDYGAEVMIQNQVVNRSACTQYMTVLATNLTFGGSYGVPVNTWNLCRNGGAGAELVFQWVPPLSTSTNFGVSSGSVDIYGMLSYLATNGYLASSSTITAMQYGFEIGSTGGVAENFYVDAFSLTASH
jgi:hypothetical protein